MAELFGHRRGAYTSAVDSMPGLVEQASGGSLFLDELASLSGEGQAALLRMLETGEIRRVGDRGKLRVDLRLLAAVQSAGRATESPAIRQDLYHRLAGAIIHVAPLRERPEDLLPLAQHLAGLHDCQVAPSVRGLLERHPWPGNVRELRYVVRRASLIAHGQVIVDADIAEAIDMVAEWSRAKPTSRPLSAQGDSEREVLLSLCRQHQGRAADIASSLGVGQSTMYRMMGKHGLKLRDFQPAAIPRQAHREREGERGGERGIAPAERALA